MADAQHERRRSHALRERLRATKPLKVEKLLEFFVERNAKNERKLRRGVELPRFDGADCVSGHPRQLGKLHLRETTLTARLSQGILQDQRFLHGCINPQSHRRIATR